MQIFLRQNLLSIVYNASEWCNFHAEVFSEQFPICKRFKLFEILDEGSIYMQSFGETTMKS